MNLSTLLIFILIGFFVSYFLGGTLAKRKAKKNGGIKTLASLPNYYAMMVAFWAFIPAIIVLLITSIFDDSLIQWIVTNQFPDDSSLEKISQNNQLIYNQIQNIASNTDSVDGLDKRYLSALVKYQSLKSMFYYLIPALTLSILALGLMIGLKSVNPRKNARKAVERVFNKFILICSLIAIFSTLGIVLSVLFESIKFFEKIPLVDFLFGTHWSPQIAIRADQAGASGAFGVIPLIVGTLLISFIALLIAVPVGLMSAIYLSEYSSKRMRNLLKPLLEILAGIPTVVYGFFAALTVAPLIRHELTGVADTVYAWGASLQNWAITNDIALLKNTNLLSMFESVGISSESALAAGLVMGIMIIPFVSSLSDDVITAVPRSLKDGSLGLGATRSETIKKVVFPAAIPGIVGGVLLAASRAIGETMIVVMAAGLAAKLSVNPLDAVTTVTVQIVTLLVGDQEFDNAKTLAAFALGLFLFVITLLLNILALKVVQKYREQYD